jgi:hypothetical protein
MIDTTKEPFYPSPKVHLKLRNNGMFVAFHDDHPLHCGIGKSETEAIDSLESSVAIRSEYKNNTLRDELAGKAMQSLVRELSDPNVIAHRAYMIADAMIKHRDKKQES